MTLIALSDPAAADAAVVGGKAATLAALLQDGYPVPEGWVIPTAVTAGVADDPGEVERLVREVDEVVDGPVAVRSSAVTEDLADASFAGMYESVLDVSGVNELGEAIRRCLAGASTDRVAHYASSDRLPPPALLIQRMVPADEAGVAFSIDPVTGRDVVRVSAVHGLGEALVSGEADPEEWTVDPVTMSATRSGAETVLAEERAIEVARLARRLADAFGRPQDVEWAVDSRGLHLLQARPITVVPVQPPALEGTGWVKDEAHYPEPLTPFGFSLSGGPVESVFPDAMLRPYGLVAGSIDYGMVGGESYMRINPLFGPSGAEGRKAPPKALMWLVSRLHPAMRSANARAAATLAEGPMERVFDRWDSEWRPMLLAQQERLRSVALDELTDDGLAAHATELLEHHTLGADIHFRLMIPYATAIFELDDQLRSELGWTTMETMRLLVGLSPASVAGRAELVGISDRIQGDPRISAAIESRPSEPVAAIEALDVDLARELSGWFERHGWRCLNYDAGSPTLIERPAVVSRMLLDGVEDRDDGADTRSAAEAVARSRLRGTALTTFEERLASARRAYPTREDNVVFTDNVPNGLLRRWALEAGRRLAARGSISRPDDIVYLTIDEIRDDLTAGPSSMERSDIVVHRKGEEAWSRANPGPRYIGEPDAMPDLTALPDPMRRFNRALMWMAGEEFPAERDVVDTDALVAGNPASPGSATGPARIVMGEADFGKVGAGDILVSPITTPAWTMLFSTAAAVVTDGGGVLSHAAIVAREHGIPAVIGAPGATTTIIDGQLIRVDGTTGLVTPA